MKLLNSNQTCPNVERNMYQDIENMLSFIPVILMIVGTLGNVTAFYVLTRKKLRSQSTMTFFASLTVVDTISLYQWNFNFFYRYQLSVQHLNLEEESLILCRYISFMAYFSLQTSAWILTFISIDRYLLLISVHYRTNSKNLKRNVTKTLVLVLLIGFINSPLTFLNGVPVSNASDPTVLKRVECYTTAYVLIWQKLSFMVDCIAPLTLMVIFNCLLIRQASTSSLKFAENRNSVLRNLDQIILNSSRLLALPNVSQYDSEVPFLSQANAPAEQKGTPSAIVSVNSEKKTAEIKMDSLKVSALTIPQSTSYSSTIAETNFTEPSVVDLTQSVPAKVKLNKADTVPFVKSTSNMKLAFSKSAPGVLQQLARARVKKNALDYRNKRLVVLLFLLTISFAVSTLPSSVFNSFLRPMVKNKPYRRVLIMSLTLLRHLSHAFNFLIYFKSSSIIKQQLDEIFKKNRA